MDIVPTGEKASMNDHDLLVVLHTQMQRVLVDLKEVKDNTIGRIAVLESSKVDLTVVTKLQTDADRIHEDFELRVRALEKTQTQTITWGAAAIIAIGLIEFAITHFFK